MGIFQTFKHTKKKKKKCNYIYIYVYITHPRTKKHMSEILVLNFFLNKSNFNDNIIKINSKQTRFAFSYMHNIYMKLKKKNIYINYY